MLSDTKLKDVKSPKRRPIGAVKKYWSDQQKLESVQLWLLSGNLRNVSASLGIPYKTLQEWRYSNWWGEVVSDIKSEGHIQLSNKLKVIAEKALDVTLDRLDNGDFYYDQKTGELRRKPVQLKDAHVVATNLLDRAIKLQETPMDEVEKHKVNDTLSALAAAFEQFAKKTRKVEVIDAIYEEREEGLPGGEELGENQETLSDQGSQGAGGSETSGGEEGWEPTNEYAGGSQEATGTRGEQQVLEFEGSVSQGKPDQGS